MNKVNIKDSQNFITSLIPQHILLEINLKY